MEKEVFDLDGKTLIRSEEAEPICGKDFCDRCGDCLHCYNCDPCGPGGEHRWVVYEDQNESSRNL